MPKTKVSKIYRPVRIGGVSEQEILKFHKADPKEVRQFNSTIGKLLEKLGY